ncbi:MAG: hypothetical protein AMJ70_02110 [Dehalococcoidia bacterium SG8_51_3]|nr:MAG: hypothetical protein AMJ70_02110 [Dehalococcoidia bacterium SG8_51_3]
MKKIAIILSLIVLLLGALSCAQGVSQQEYDRVSGELQAIQNQLAALQDKLAEAELLQAKNDLLNKQLEAAKNELEAAEAKYEGLSAEYDELNETVSVEFEAIQAEYEDLSTKYAELNKQFEELSEQLGATGGAGIEERDIEQAVLKLVNQERTNRGLDELAWGENLYKWALTNSRNMAASQQLEYSEYVGWQDVYRATGYHTADEMASATLVIWKETPQYERNFLNVGADYGAVGVYKSGEIFYITFLADYFH